MPIAQNAMDQASNAVKTVDASLWWDSFALLLTELENLSLSSDLPSSAEKKLKENHAWFLDTVNLFKPPNQKSRESLDAKQVKIGSRHLTIQSELKDAALKTSSLLCLDEVQSYILVERSVERNAMSFDSVFHDFHHLVMVQYYIERQCLLKCARQILMHALYVKSGLKGHAMCEAAQKLISDGLVDRLLSILEDLLSANYPEQMDVDLYAFWAEETLIEDNLVLDILFLAYYESFCTCDSKHWKKLLLLYKDSASGSFNLRNLSISADAICSTYYVKAQLLLILIETLDLENLLQMIHDEIPFRQGSVAFSLVDVQEMDAMVSDMDAFQTKEAGPLILAWAVFLCLISALPEKEDNPLLMEMDHVNYVRQAIEAASLGYFLEILESNILKESEGPTAGYRSVLRTFISAFVASYEINLQLDDENLKSILDIICKIYRGEESLCIQFWDRDSFVDGPIRCLLCSLEGEFPFRTVEFVRLSSALAEGTWPAECVYNFLNKSVQVTSLFEIRNDSLVDATSKIVKTSLPVHVHGVEGLTIPSGTRGRVLRMLHGSTAVVRWEHAQSGVVVLILRLAQALYLDSSEEVLLILDLLSRIVTFNTAACYALMETGKSSCDEVTLGEGQPEKYWRVNVVEMICTLVKNLPPTSYGAAVMALGVNILANMLKCSPANVTAMIMRENIFDVALQTHPFDVGSNGFSRGTWLLSGRLAKMLLIDSEHSDCSLTLSVLDFTIQLVETGAENDNVLALVIFSLQYVLVNHDVWTYKMKDAHWKVTLKVLDVVKKSILVIPYREKLGCMIQDILLCDPSIHSALFRIVCTTAQSLEKLHMSRLYELIDIEGVQLAISSGLDILSSMLSVLSKDLSSASVFHKAILSPLTKPIPVVAAVLSLISYFQHSKIQVAAARLLSLLFVTGDAQESLEFSNACLGLDDKQISQFRNAIYSILSEHSLRNEELVIATLKLLSSVACYQPAFLAAVVTSQEGTNAQFSGPSKEMHPNKADIKLMGLKEANIMDAVLQFVRQSKDLIKSKPNVLLNVLNFLRALWQGAPQFTKILQQLKNSLKFWEHLFDSIVLISDMPDNPSESLPDIELQKLAYRYYCQSDVLEIIAYEFFLHKKLLHAELLVKETSDSSKDKGDKPEGSKLENDESAQSLRNLLSTSFSNSLGKVIKSYASCKYEHGMHADAKVAASLFSVHAMGKLMNGEMGSMSVLLVQKILTLSDKLRNLPAFSELLTRYAQRNYSRGKDLQYLILSDLFYHLQGELEGRQIDDRSFKELLQYLLQSNFLPTYLCKHDDNLQAHPKNPPLYDLCHLQSDLALELWDLSEWKESKAVAEKMLHCLEDVNGKLLLTSSKLSAQKALVAMLSLYSDNLTKNAGEKMPEQLISSSIDHVCQSLHSSTETLGPGLDDSEDVLDIVETQVELLLHLVKYLGKNSSMHTYVLVLKTSGQCLKVLSTLRPSDAGVRRTMKLLLMLILFSFKLNFMEAHPDVGTSVESIENSAEVSNMHLGLLPVLCHCIRFADHCAISLTTIDIILRGFSTPSSWFPIIHKHLQLHYVVQRLQDKNSAIFPIVLEFLLTLSRVREAAKMLVDAGFFTSIRGVLAEFSDDGLCSVAQTEMSLSDALNKIEKPKHIWGLCLAVVTSVIQSLGDSSSDSGVVDYVMTHLLVEKAYLISYYLNAPDFPSNDNYKKRARSPKRRTTLSTLKETEQTLLLICVLARYRNSWNKTMKEMDSQLREKSIHLLAFISRGIQHHGELPGRVAPLLCHPNLKEEFEWYKKPSFINSRNGWFVLSPLGCGLDPKFSSLLSRSTALVTKDHSNGHATQTHFSDITAIQIYRIAFLLLKFLCIQAEGASKRAEELGFVDHAHFPELPMPDILHGLQDQGIIIVSELCEAKLDQATPDIQGICFLLLQITIMALYLEFCLIQICGMRPVLGRAEDFLKEYRMIVQAAERHAFLKETMKSLKQIVSFVYPELLQITEYSQWLLNLNVYIRGLISRHFSMVLVQRFDGPCPGKFRRQPVDDQDDNS